MSAPSEAVNARPVVRVVERRFGRLRIHVLTAAPEPHEIDMDYSITGSAKVSLDRKPFAEFRVIVRDQTVLVPLGGTPPQEISLRFAGIVRPRLVLHLNGTPVTGLL
ncbi:MAG TPA: hypothetical protein VJ397_06885 [Thermoplasmata archaeon]|nr:hypothetical protein [Thermoplasmata archaeon]